MSELPADRSVNYFVDEVDDSSSGRSLRMRCLVQHEPAGSHSTARTSVVPWTAGDGHLVGSSGVKAMLVAADGRAAERGVEEVSCWSPSSSVCSTCLAVTLGEHSSRGPCQPQAGPGD
jgi:hypothetical protein